MWICLHTFIWMAHGMSHANLAVSTGRKRSREGSTSSSEFGEDEPVEHLKRHMQMIRNSIKTSAEFVLSSVRLNENNTLPDVLAMFSTIELEVRSIQDHCKGGREVQKMLAKAHAEAPSGGSGA